MNLTDDFILKCQAGIPVLLDDICAVYPATLREIAGVGYTKFLMLIQTILITKPVLDKGNEELEKILDSMNEFQYFLTMVSMDKEFNELAKEAFSFFTKEKVSFSLDPAQIVIGPLVEKHFLDESHFFSLREILKKMYFLDDGEEEIVIHEDDSPRVKDIKRKMIKNRELVAKAKKKGGKSSDLAFSDLVGSVALKVPGLNLNNIFDLTYYAFQDQLKRMGWQEEYDTNTRAALAGAKINKNQLKYWIRPIRGTGSES